MKPTKLDILDIATYDNLIDAVIKAARGKRTRTEVQAFFNSFDTHIHSLHEAILNREAPFGLYKQFIIFDPKKRTIHAACFKDRILHHALINYIGPVLERAMIQHSFACRPNKGPILAIQWVQHYIRRFSWYVKVDIKSYFDSIDYTCLKQVLARQVKGEEVKRFIYRIIDSYHSVPGKGLPIGALTSQHFSNYYLDGLDRFILEELKVCGYVRYMDDMIWWCRDKSDAKKKLSRVKMWVTENRKLEIKENCQIGRSGQGVTFCGFRILPGDIKLSHPRRRGYALKRKQWENDFIWGRITGRELQAAYDAIFSVTAHGNSREWRKQQLRRCQSIEV